VDYVIPGNDDALRAIRLFTSKISESIAEGAQFDDRQAGADMQAAADAAQLRRRLRPKKRQWMRAKKSAWKKCWVGNAQEAGGEREELPKVESQTV